MNVKKTIKPKTKTNKKDLKYREKIVSTHWACQICDALNTQADLYCANCLQNLYYYNYINRHIFVAKDEPQNQPAEIKRKNSTHSWATDDTCDDSHSEDD